MIFQGRGLGSGIPRYADKPGFPTMDAKPIAVGARWFPPDPDYDEDDNPVPLAMGSKWEGGREVYQLKVYEAAKEHGKDLGMKQKDIDDLKPFAPDGGFRASLGFQPLSHARELYDYTTFDWPAANVTNTSSEEIELDQAMSLADRRGRRFFGCQLENVMLDIAAFVITGTADHVVWDIMSLATRTGTFHIDDPELLWRYEVAHVMNVTEASAYTYVDPLETSPRGEVYVAPRLFFRYENQHDATKSAGASYARIATVAQSLSFPTFIELLEKFADVTLL